MISKFEGRYAFLSNFYSSEIIICLVNGEYRTAPTVEHYFQAMKTTDVAEQINILSAVTPGKAKRLGRRCHLRDDWDKIKNDVMLNALEQKFKNKRLRNLLLDTGSETLIEGNTWGDRYWGVCNDTGLNNLGYLLMVVRENIRKNEK